MDVPIITCPIITLTQKDEQKNDTFSINFDSSWYF